MKDQKGRDEHSSNPNLLLPPCQQEPPKSPPVIAFWFGATFVQKYPFSLACGPVVSLYMFIIHKSFLLKI